MWDTKDDQILAFQLKIKLHINLYLIDTLILNSSEQFVIASLTSHSVSQVFTLEDLGFFFLSETIHDKVTSFSICGVCWSLVERAELGSLRKFFLNILLLQNSQVIHLSVTVCQCNCVLL